MGTRCSGSDLGRQRQAINAFCLILPMGEKLKKHTHQDTRQERAGD